MTGEGGSIETPTDAQSATSSANPFDKREMMPTETTKDLLAGVLKWLDEREAHRLTTLAPGADPTKLGYPGLASKMLRAMRAGLVVDAVVVELHGEIEQLRREVERLRVLLGHIPSVGDLVDVACKDGRDIHLAALAPTNEWRVGKVEQLWNIGAHDDPGFTIEGSRYIHTIEGFRKTWRFHEGTP
jgi:hypothetical protein